MSAVASAVQALVPLFGGQLILPADAAYETTRRLHNGMIDKRPAVIARCRGTADIAEAIQLARTHHLPIAIRGGGHNVSGSACVDNGVMIDLSLLKSVHVDPASKTAWVDGGATWREINRETQHYGLATTGGVVSSTGVAGLTLGGGLGWLMAKYGLALDNLRSATLVLADGRTVRTSANDHPDLFWAIRGGGGNFGVAASFEFQLHQVGPMVTSGLVAHPLPRGREVLQFYRDRAASLPDEMFLVSALATAPDGSGHKIVAVGAMHCGSLEAGAAAVAPIKAFGPPVMDVMGPMPYSAANMMLDAGLPRGARNYWKSHFLPALSDGAIDALVQHFEQSPGPMCQIILEHFHGAAARVAVDATAFALRQEGFNMLVLAQWMDPADDARMIEWCRAGYAVMQPFVGPRRYINYLHHDDAAAGEKTLSAVYGPNLPRLRQIKAKYDPENVFRLNVNIPPA